MTRRSKKDLVKSRDGGEQSQISQTKWLYGLTSVEHRSAANGCRACDLWNTATQTVFGEGPSKARIMMVGEQPGDQEDLTGQPFVGPAGKVLDQTLEEAGIDRADVLPHQCHQHRETFQMGGIGTRQATHSPKATRRRNRSGGWIPS